MSDDPLMETRLALSEIKGMLKVLTDSHSNTLAAHSLRLGEHETRLNVKGKDIATIQEQNKNQAEDIRELKDNDKGQQAKNISVGNMIFTAIVSCIVIFNFIQGSVVP